MKLTGRSIIGYRQGAPSSETFHGTNPGTGENLEPTYHSATSREVSDAAELAGRAFLIYRGYGGRERAVFLRKIAEEIDGLGSFLIERVMQETALSEERVKSERMRTCGQLHLFASLVEEGSWVDARVDFGNPTRLPLPKPDLRSMLKGIGPVVVFGPANFPLAYSVAGGDTASALAAGCPVIVKAHPSHPGTSELVGGAVRRAAESCKLPEGVFSLLFDSGNKVAQALVQHSSTKAVGFTGSKTGGRELFNLACCRPDPIPFFGELSSLNPVFLLPRALSERADKIAESLHASVTQGLGQFCTKPGIILVHEGVEAQGFASHLKKLILGTATGIMLNKGTRSRYIDCLGKLASLKEVTVHVDGDYEPGNGEAATGAAFFQSTVKAFLKDPTLAIEVFGPSTVLLTYSTFEELLTFASTIEGQLTATVHGTEEDLRAHAGLIALLEIKAGRIVFNGVPTGLEVCPSTVHGGPWPSSTDSRFTSMGTGAIRRFARPVCYQNSLPALLPPELQDGNPLGLWRLIDGKREKLFMNHYTS